MEGTEDLDVQVLKNSPAYGTWNVSIVATGTGETLPSPIICAVFMSVVVVNMMIGSGDAL
ncbi:MAG: hypothetical protein WBB62_19715 [Rhodococcus sp. (in: high G+C Gram-positive bacteria)]|jgi:hypothetical protein|uniref:hypothetical protein n=1 Tax=Rhodococcus sp. KRD197 TaxID=2729731 RepID=UPI0019D1DF8D|nr:hypothetical protein [Rhodococcus sp. KRD197]